ncbi:MAG: cyclic nucleotide-binding domain-containing protein [Deltaproteobacteria bacterium]|nr:cyclic nucleotide-binding domain-containing protein [Deltaproteobacteria bacterium]MBW2382679.1 cyclic nucleotide-binding domain-containing protein [Deltaproteobacteria bacterium]
MALPHHQELRRKASLALRSGDHASALEVYLQLEALEPDDPTWLERAGRSLLELGDGDQALTRFTRALELQIDAGEVLAAIATCQQILEIEPDHPATLDCLHLLYTEPGGPETAPRTAPAIETGADDFSMPQNPRAPFEELELTEVIPGSRGVQLGDGDPRRVAEIPLDETGSGLDPLGELDVDLVDAVHASEPLHAGGTGVTALPSATDDLVESPVASRELADIPLFGSLDAATLHRLMALVSVVRIDEGETLFREGEAADCLYVVVEGAVIPIAEGPPRTRMAVLEKGEFFGEAGLVTNQPRNATIEALVDSRLIGMDRELMWSLIRGRPEMSKVLLRFLRQRLIDRQISTHPFFAAFSRADRPSVARQFRFLEVQDAVPVLEQGVPGEGLFVLLAGTMDVEDDETDKLLGSLAPGDVFGARSAARDEFARASVVADGKCWVLVLEKARLRRILGANPRLDRHLKSLIDDGELGPFGL